MGILMFKVCFYPAFKKGSLPSFQQAVEMTLWVPSALEISLMAIKVSINQTMPCTTGTEHSLKLPIIWLGLETWRAMRRLLGQKSERKMMELFQTYFCLLKYSSTAFTHSL